MCGMARRKSPCVAGLQGKKLHEALSHKKPILFLAVLHLWDSKHVPSGNEVSDTHHHQSAGRETTLLVGKCQSHGSKPAAERGGQPEALSLSPPCLAELKWKNAFNDLLMSSSPQHA